MLSSAVLSYRLGTNSREGKKKLVWINKWLHLSPPLVCGKLIIYLHIHNHSLLHFLCTSTCPHGTVMAIYRHMRACSLIYARADMKAAGDREVSGMEGGWSGGVTLKHSEPRAILGESAAWVRSFTSEGEERSVPSWVGKGEFNLPSLLSQPGHPKTWHWPPKLHNQ